MTALIDENTTVICQGMTGREGTFYTQRALEYGTKIVAGVTPGKGGKKHIDIPVFNSVAEARDQTGATASILFVPPQNAADAMVEAIEAELDLVVAVTERVPIHDMARVKQALKGSKTKLIGPNSHGILAPGRCMIGVMSTVDAKPGRIAIASRSASLTSEIVWQTSELGLGQSLTIGIGGDPVHGMSFVDCLDIFFQDPDTDGVILIGEIGGAEEQDAADYLKSRGIAKPVVAYVAGKHAPKSRRLGHAGTVSNFGRGDAASKIDALRMAGAITVANADQIAPAIQNIVTK